jgi:putative intracellular protease/amidase
VESLPLADSDLADPYDDDLMRTTQHFVREEKPVASICHGIEIIAAADVIRGREVTTIPKCRYDAEFRGATYLEQKDGRELRNIQLASSSQLVNIQQILHQLARSTFGVVTISHQPVGIANCHNGQTA